MVPAKVDPSRMFQAFYTESSEGVFTLVAVFYENGQVQDERCTDGLDTMERFRQGLDNSTNRAVQIIQCGDLTKVPLRV